MISDHRPTRIIISWTLIILAIVSLSMSWSATRDQARTAERQQEYARCQQDWTTFLLRSITLSRSASSEAQAAMDDLVNAISQAKSREETEAALARYKAAREAQKATVTNNPLPPPPKQVCGDV